MSGSTYPLGPGDQPAWPAGYVPSAAEWNMWWSNKVDADNPELVGGPFLPIAGGTMLGAIVLPGPPTQGNQACTKAYADSLTGAAGPFLPMSGGTMTGVLTLASDPTAPLQAVTKQYADNITAIANNAISIANAATNTANAAVPRSGAVMTGFLTLAGDPSSPLMASTKQYVDNHFLPLSGGTVNFINVSGTGINFPNYSGSHRFALNWDGQFILGYVDGSYTGQLATVGWAQGQFATYGWVQGNYYSAGTSDGRYLYKTGDTCTGGFNVNGLLQAGSFNTNGGTFTSVNVNGQMSCGNVTCGSSAAIGANGIVYTAVDTHFFEFWYYGPSGVVFTRLDGGTDVSIGQVSDAKLKTEVAPSTFDGLAAIRRIALYGYRMQTLEGEAGDEVPLGFVAQQLAEVFPEAVIDTGKNLAINTNVVLAALCDAIQKLTAPGMKA